MPGIPTLADIQAAAARIRAHVHRTPLMTSRSFDRQAGLRAVFKCENLQRAGSFKIRGATNFLLSLSPGEQSRGVVAYSSGNHAQAVALAASSLGVAATIVMPADAPAVKLEATRDYGARIVFYDRQREDREAIAGRIADETGAVVVPPFDHPWIVAGQGTLALEALQDMAAVPQALVVPVGGGGLASGCAIAAHGLAPSIRVFGVEPELAQDTYLSLSAGRRVSIAPPATVADGLRVTAPGEFTLPILQRHLEGVLLVSEEEILEAMRFLLMRMKILVEPSGAAAAAAVLFGKLPASVQSALVVLSGGNAELKAIPAGR